MGHRRLRRPRPRLGPYFFFFLPHFFFFAAAAPLGGETTIIALDAGLTALRRFPNVDLGASATMRPELLVGDAGAEAIAKARAESLPG